MTDAVTIAKNLTQQAVGGHNNEWGTILNQNFGLIDSALGGSLSKTITGNVSLLGTEAQNTGYVFSGSFGATATVTFPAYYGLAVIHNQTNQSIRCGVSGGSFVTIPSTLSGAIWSDGLNFTVLNNVGSLLNLAATYGGIRHNQLSLDFTIDQALVDGAVNVTHLKTTVNGAMSGKELWVNFDEVTYDVVGGDASNGGNLVGRYIGVQRQTSAANVPVNGLIVALTDITGQASSVGGGLYGVEIDLQCNGDDDGTVQFRRGLHIALGKQINADTAPSAAKGISLVSGSGVSGSGTDGKGFFIPVSIETPFRDAGIDFRNANVWSGGGGSGHAMWLKQPFDLALDTAGSGGSAKVVIGSDGTRLTVTTGIKLGSNASSFIGNDAGNTVLTCGLPWRLPGYTVAALPVLIAPDYGSLAFASDARNSGEGAGVGTGCLVYLTTTGTWVAAWSGLAPTI